MPPKKTTAKKTTRKAVNKTAHKKAAKGKKPLGTKKGTKKTKKTARKGKMVTRRSKLTKQMIEMVCKNLMAGNTKKTTCMAVGITETTFYRWMEAGASPEGTKMEREFCESVNKACATLKTVLVSKIMNSQKWQAQAWLLERMFYKEYGRRQLIAHAGADGESPVAMEGGGAPVVNVIMQPPASGKDPWIDKTKG